MIKKNNLKILIILLFFLVFSVSAEEAIQSDIFSPVDLTTESETEKTQTEKIQSYFEPTRSYQLYTYPAVDEPKKEPVVLQPAMPDATMIEDTKSYELETFFPVEKPQKPAIEQKESPKKEKPSKKKKKNKNKKFNYSTNKNEEIPRGYYGEIPDISADFKYMQQQTATSTNLDMKTVSEDELNENNFKEAPYDDTLFLDKIVKKEPDSQYVNDLVKIKHALLNLQKCIEENGNIQRFNANVNSIDLYCQSFEKKYKNTSNSLKESYNDILATNYYAKTLGNLKYDANYYSKYVPTQQGQYSKTNIDNQEQKLLNKVNKTIYVLMREME